MEWDHRSEQETAQGHRDRMAQMRATRRESSAQRAAKAGTEGIEWKTRIWHKRSPVVAAYEPGVGGGGGG